MIEQQTNGPSLQMLTGDERRPPDGCKRGVGYPSSQKWLYRLWRASCGIFGWVVRHGAAGGLGLSGSGKRQGVRDMTGIDSLSSKARRQAEKLNRTLDRLESLGVSANVWSNSLFAAGVTRVRLVLTQPAHYPTTPTTADAKKGD